MLAAAFDLVALPGQPALGARELGPAGRDDGALDAPGLDEEVDVEPHVGVLGVRLVDVVPARYSAAAVLLLLQSGAAVRGPL